MADDIEGLLALREDATMTDAVDQLAKIKLILEYVKSGADAYLGPEHLATVGITNKASEVETKIDELHAALRGFEGLVKNIVDDVIRGLQS